METFQTEGFESFGGSNFSVGGILSRAYAVLCKNPALFLGLAAVETLAPVLITAPIGGLAGTEAESLRLAVVQGALRTVVENVCTLILQGATAYGVYQALQGRMASFGEAVGRGMKRFFPLFAISILVGIGTGIGMVCLIIPGLVLMCIWAVAVPACVVERLGPIASMSRSGELTKGYRWKIFGLNILMLLCMFVVGIAAGVCFAFLGIGDGIAGELAVNLVVIVPGAFFSVMVSVVYYELRLVKEGVAIDKLANVFD